jgi:hypothetical protein
MTFTSITITYKNTKRLITHAPPLGQNEQRRKRKWRNSIESKMNIWGKLVPCESIGYVRNKPPNVKDQPGRPSEDRQAPQPIDPPSAESPCWAAVQSGDAI